MSERDAKPAPLRSIAECGSTWDEGVPDELRAALEAAIANDDRVLILSVRRGKADGEPATCVTATCDRKQPCAVPWVEFVGVLAVKLHQWIGDTGED